MAKIVQMTSAENQHYSTKIYSDRLKKLTRSCPDDGQQMWANGFMYMATVGADWYVQYVCSKDGEIYWNRTRDIEKMTQQIAKEVLELGQDDES